MSLSLPTDDLSQNPILLVEPSTPTCKRISVAFQSVNLRLLTAATGAEALDMVHGLIVPALAIIELALPDMDGGELARKLYQSRRIPIIMLAYHADPPTIADLLNIVAEDFILKPFDERELVVRAIRLLPRALRNHIGDPRGGLETQKRIDHARGQFKLAN